MVFVGCAPRTVAFMVVRKAHPTQLLLSCDNPLEAFRLQSFLAFEFDAH
jgi:hypothetical protein